MSEDQSPAIAQSTIQAAVYLIQHAPDRLRDWLLEHGSDAGLIERAAREQIAEGRRR